MTYRIFHAAGPGNIIQAHKHWKNGEQDPNIVLITYSSQFVEFCRDIGAEAYIVSSYGRRELFRDGPYTLEHRPKPLPRAAGMRYHLSQVLYGLSLFATAVRYRANAALIDSGSTHYFVTSIFRLAGIPVVTKLHNTLWPLGFPPTRVVPRLIAKLDSLFFRWASTATIGISPECLRQVDQLTRRRHKPVYQFEGQFRPQYFADIPPPPPHGEQPFRVMYAGRISRDKGVFDILEMARSVEARAPGSVQWELCGSGPDMDELKRLHSVMGLAGIVSIRGWTSPDDMRSVFARSHLSIVPTRSEFREGMAMTAVEAILAGRPVITSPVVPALEVLRPACIEAKTDDVDSYVEALVELIADPTTYRSLCAACPGLVSRFYDRKRGLRAVLGRVFEAIR